jgi:hypothetical protein
MFCPKCGVGDQSAESYCRRCGKWLPDMEGRTRPRLFPRTPKQKIRKMRVLEIMSAALALAAAAMIFYFPSSQGDMSLLNLAGTFCVAIALYQAVNFYFGLTLHPKRGKNEVEGGGEIPIDTKELPQPFIEQGEKEFIELPSITENTTDLLRPMPRAAERKQHQ